MKKSGVKYFLIILVFIIGVSIGDLRKNSGNVVEDNPKKDELILSLEEMESNFFVKASKSIEKMIRYIFYVIFEFSGKLIKFVFGM